MLPAWLSAWALSLVQKVLLPFVKGIVEDIVAKLELTARLNALEKNQNATLDAFHKLATAKESKDYDEASKLLADSWNHGK